MIEKEKPVKVRCVIPDCPIYSKPPEAGEPPLCHEHKEAFKVFMFFIRGVKFAQAPAPPPRIAVPKLVTPQGLPFRGR